MLLPVLTDLLYHLLVTTGTIRQKAYCIFVHEFRTLLSWVRSSKSTNFMKANPVNIISLTATVHRTLTLYVPIIAILDIWKNARVSVLSYISLPVHILYDNPNIFLKLIKFVSF